jgi:hypothetical protein
MHVGVPPGPARPTGWCSPTGCWSPLLAARGFTVPGLPGVRLRTLVDVVAYAAAHGVELRINGTETQVRRPRANRAGRRAFVSGKRKQNTIKRCRLRRRLLHSDAASNSHRNRTHRAGR